MTELKLRIDSTKSRWWFAELWLSDDGVVVEIWQRMPGETGPAKLACRDVLEVPLHVAIDKVSVLLDQLDSPRQPGGRRPRG
jgi:hypothetical protein